MIYHPQRHERVTDTPWDESAARAAIAAIARDADDTFDEHTLWPIHDLDSDMPGAVHKSLYFGAAGTMWALGHLARCGVAQTRDWSVYAKPLVELYLREPDTGLAVASYGIGECGVLLVAWSLDSDAVDLDYLYRLIDTNTHNVANETLWGGPGTMLAAQFLYERTGEDRWRTLVDANVDVLVGALVPNGDAGCSLWTQNLYGELVTLIGAGHGFAGNAYAALRGGAGDGPKPRVAETLRVAALEEGGSANWPQHLGVGRRGRDDLLVQWCHGAPGMITALSDYLDDDESDRLLRAGGELVWNAGPLAKGAGICHGTAGNGYALLKLFRRTGDAQWLDRARRFAMHAIAQSELLRTHYGQGRYSLWNGDPGVACYLHACIEGTAEVPSLDVF